AYARAGVRVVVVGRCGLGRTPVDNVLIVGEVPDVADYLRASDLALCPLVSGSGTSLKTIEYLAAGLPLVSTEVGVRYLGLRPDGAPAVRRRRRRTLRPLAQPHTLEPGPPPARAPRRPL